MNFKNLKLKSLIGPLNPAEIAEMLQLDPADAFDAALVTGGLPQICGEWPAGQPVWSHLRAILDDSLSALTTSGERSLAAEFPPDAHARRVLSAIGDGNRSFSNISRATGGMPPSSLQHALTMLHDKRLILTELPLSTKPSKERRYQIADPYLRFWLAFIEPSMNELDRQRGDLVFHRIRTSWSSWRGSVIEPIVRDALWRLLPDDQIDVTPAAVGSYWTRKNDVEIDVVIADRAPIAKQIRAIGSIKWRDDSPFDVRDLGDLRRHHASLTDEAVPLIAVSRSGVSTGGLDATYSPDDLIAAWS